MKSIRHYLQIALKGMAMGIAEVIPGVSGGTIAFITGIYEQLIDSIRSFGPGLIGTFKKDGWRGLWNAIHGDFLLALLCGMGGGVIIGVLVITHILETHPEHLWAFFFGLILASAVYIGRQIRSWTMKEILGLLIAVVLSYWITITSPAGGNDAYWFIFLSGMLAISALILPGISGSFILLLLGMYTLVIPSVKSALSSFDTASILILLVFGLGCIVGLATFSHVLSWMFKHLRDLTLAVLTGFMIGSLNKIWPWRNVIEERINSRGELVPFIEKSVWPANYEGDPHVTGVCILMLIGMAIVFAFYKLSPEKPLPTAT